MIHRSRILRRALPLVGVLVALCLLLVGAPSAGAQPGPTAVAPQCPPPMSATLGSVDVCIDRGEGAIYQVGEPITICVTASIPQIAIFPPPPPPLVRVVNAVNGGPERVVFEEAFAAGQRCLALSIVPPTGNELIRADVIGQDGQIIASDQVTFTSVGG